MPVQLEMGLLGNAIDYLENAAETANDEATQFSFKYGVLHLVAGIELLLKARLQNEHWSLVFRDPDKASRQRLETGDFASVDLDAALGRLKSICEVTFRNDDEELLDALKRLRNRIQHFSIQVDHSTLMSLLAFGYEFALWFMENHLDSEIPSEKVSSLSLQLTGFKEFSTRRMESIRADVEGAPASITCDRCLHESLVVGAGNPHCLFCGLSMTPRQLADECPGEIEALCPECDGPCIMYFIDSTGSKWLCYNCGLQGDFINCERCGRLIEVGDDQTFELCDTCWDEIQNDPRT